MNSFEITNKLNELLIDNNKEIVFICIGTDKCIGDSLGPIIGTFLKKENCPYKVYGTISEPIHALNIKKTINKIKAQHGNSTIIAIDACLGGDEGKIIIENSPIKPGAGVNKDLPPVGDIGIKAIVNSQDNLLPLQNIRLNFVIELSKIITKGIMNFCDYRVNKIKKII